MKTKHMYLSLYVLSMVAVLANSFDPVTTTVLVGVGAGLGRTIWNYFQESCGPKWISLNSTGERLTCLPNVQLLTAAGFRWVSRNQDAVLCNRGRVSQEHRCQISPPPQKKHNLNKRRRKRALASILWLINMECICSKDLHSNVRIL